METIQDKPDSNAAFFLKANNAQQHKTYRRLRRYKILISEHPTFYKYSAIVRKGLVGLILTTERRYSGSRPFPGRTERQHSEDR